MKFTGEIIDLLSTSSIPPASPAEIEFSQACGAYLSEVEDYRRGFAIYLHNAELLGLIKRDARGRFTSMSEDTEVISVTVSKPRRKSRVISAKVMAEAKSALYDSVFNWKTRDDVAIGEVYFSAISHRIGTNNKENHVYRGILALGIPPTDQQVREYVPADVLKNLIAEAEGK